MGQTQSAGPPGPMGPTGATGPGFIVADASMKCADIPHWPAQMCFKELPDRADDAAATPPIDGAVCVKVPKFRTGDICENVVQPDAWVCSPNPIIALHKVDEMVGWMEEECGALRHDACSIVDVKTDRPYVSFGYDPLTRRIPEGEYRLDKMRGEECCLHSDGSESICVRGPGSSDDTFHVPEHGKEYTASTDLTAKWREARVQ
ncbi:hypothetical protein AB1Y20_008570 [Prymnesium parvum]|uniref:Uncharacterized protein n=1 Tax=Prymnesium parvum TaxID=97485 RepID=A0AB34IQP0_PRYPA